MQFNPDEFIFFKWGWVKINATILFTWLIMALLTLSSVLITRNLTESPAISQRQNLVELLVGGIAGQIRDITHQPPFKFLPFVGTLFLFILLSNVLTIVPFYMPPTGSLSTTTALAVCVFVAVPTFGLSTRSLRSYLAEYIKPSIFMLPFNIIGEITRTFALAVRLYGNLMSGTVIGMVLLLIVPLFFPIIMQVLGLLTGVIQAYIFAVLAMVYIASALKKDKEKHKAAQNAKQEE